MSKPTVIIRTLEDSPVQLDQQLVMAYLSTHYWVEWPDELGHVLRVGDQDSAFLRHLSEQFINSFAIITASNPASLLLTAAENKARKELLEKECMHLQRYPAQNISPQGDWPHEEGFCFCGMDTATAIALARKHGQNALLFWQTGNMVELWWVADGD